jgi:hypothetical protein
MAGGIEGGRPHFERTPQPSKPTDQHKPHLEDANGSPGLPPTLNERAKPPPESKANNPLVEKKGERTNPGGAIFDCAVPEVIPSPFHIRRMLRDDFVTEEQAQELEQQWQEAVETMDRRSLEGEVRWWEMMRDSFTKEQQLEEVQEIEQQLEIIRKQLRQRGGD